VYLYFLRHGSPVEPIDWHGNERERPLTDEGRAELRAVAQGLLPLALPLAAIYTSPFTRARETAEIVAAALHVPVTEAPELAPGCDREALAALLARAPTASAANGLLLVGHEPDLSTLIGSLIGRHEPARVAMKKASCCCVAIAEGVTAAPALAGSGILVWLITAGQLALLAQLQGH
jgi:phosphohistidine phosphatase